MNHCQRENDWFGLYRHAFGDDVLIPKIRRPRKNGASPALLEVDADDVRDPTQHHGNL